ncbi:interferon-induced transmembrane protein 1-like [Protopterus annectens]|uniref:interferon-induced transmembrane protein 1-like n=1 Tax=Protopterus annectens TaxID=7888 RepID=UPI001CF95B85|nr:interferon-induced transmembrane protein 1-like [Protopterus annectens]
MDSSHNCCNNHNSELGDIGFVPPPPPYWSLSSQDGHKDIPSVPPYDSQGYYPPPDYSGFYSQGSLPAPNVINAQPAIIVTQPYSGYPVPQDYLAFSIVTMLFCCLPLGIAALIYSVQTRDAISYGNLEEAQRKSLISRNLNISALVFGIAIIAVVIILQFTVVIYHT